MNNLQIKYNKIWKEQLNFEQTINGQGNKLRTYKLFKTNLCFEKYLLSKNSKINELTRFRISAHNLEIEKGRHNNIPAGQRYCKLCNNNSVENEIHFLLQCPKLDRLPFIASISEQYPNFINLDDKNKFIWLMSNEDQTIIKTLTNISNHCKSTQIICII